MSSKFTKNEEKTKKVFIRDVRKDICDELGKALANLEFLMRNQNKEKQKESAKYLYECPLILLKILNIKMGLLIDELQYAKYAEAEKPIYLMSSRFLIECFDYLSQREVESMHFVTGHEIENRNVRVLDKVLEVEHEEQSIVSARADDESVRKTLIHLYENNLRLLGYFHIHPGSGPGSTNPSDKDLTLENKLERGGYEAIGAIFSRDGYIRFFSANTKNYEIQISGEGVEKISDGLYKLTKNR